MVFRSLSRFYVVQGLRIVGTLRGLGGRGAGVGDHTSSKRPYRVPMKDSGSSALNFTVVKGLGFRVLRV